MVEIVSFLGGAVLRLITGGVDYFNKKQENQHELDLLDRQTKLDELRGREKREEIIVQGQAQVDVEWSKALSVALAASAPTTGNPIIDTLNGLVRPVITYWWCLILYTTAKGFIIYDAVTAENIQPKEVAGLIVTDFDRSVIGSILGFWFADRALRYATSRR